MTRDRIYGYFIEKGNDCAGTIPCALDDEYQLGILDGSVKLVGGFGGGVGCGRACGALYGGCSAVNYRLVKRRAHATPEPKPTVTMFAEKFMGRSDSNTCYELVKIYKKEDIRCLDTVCMAADIADVCFERVLPAEERK